LLTGSLSTPGNVSLTTQGSDDWVHWGLSSPSSVNRKAAVTPQISALTLIGSGTIPDRFTDSVSTYSWIDGTPTANVSNTTTGVYIQNFDGPGRGMQFTVPADAIARTLKVYLGEFSATGTLTATLSDASAAAFTNTMTGIADNTVQGVYTLNYAANSPGQTLTVKWVETGALGAFDNMTMQAATLSSVPEPASIALLGLASAALLVRRRRA
jgi:hypothetical protein